MTTAIDFMRLLELGDKVSLTPTLSVLHTDSRHLCRLNIPLRVSTNAGTRA